MTRNVVIDEGAFSKDVKKELNDNFRELYSRSNTATIAAGSAITLTTEDAGSTILLDTATGSTVTLPAATGSGAVYKFIVSVLATSNSHVIKVESAADSMQGFAFYRDDTSFNANAFFADAGTSDTITLNRSTTGSVVVGETITITDISSGRFHVEAFIANTGITASPFTATVS